MPASSSPLSRSSTCFWKRWRWSMGSLSSEKALPISLWQMNSSKRSVRRRIAGRALGQGRHVHGVHGDKGGLNELLLHLLVKALVQSVAPGLVGGLRQLYADGLGGSHGLLIGGDGHKVDAAVLLDRLVPWAYGASRGSGRSSRPATPPDRCPGSSERRRTADLRRGPSCR